MKQLLYILFLIPALAPSAQVQTTGSERAYYSMEAKGWVSKCAFSDILVYAVWIENCHGNYLVLWNLEMEEAEFDALSECDWVFANGLTPMGSNYGTKVVFRAEGCEFFERISQLKL